MESGDRIVAGQNDEPLRRVSQGPEWNSRRLIRRCGSQPSWLGLALRFWPSSNCQLESKSPWAAAPVADSARENWSLSKQSQNPWTVHIPRPARPQKLPKNSRGRAESRGRCPPAVASALAIGSRQTAASPWANIRLFSRSAAKARQARISSAVR